ncbi:hypothetical protein R1flu_019349 [Riccia fluitans]|uniref:Uncharacterized protein n=1 Tax=Riccia fluitans TaxID=41844 RepID=A0ABD1ZJZ0_9MARC
MRSNLPVNFHGNLVRATIDKKELSTDLPQAKAEKRPVRAVEALFTRNDVKDMKAVSEGKTKERQAF